MTQVTGEAVHLRTEELEQAAASILGRLLFDFSRLELELGLLLVWTGEGSRLNELTAQVAGHTFQKKLAFLRKLVGAKFKKDSAGHSAYSGWLRRTHTARVSRNRLVHGRWGIDANQQRIINVMGLPTSPDQNEVRYSLRELEDVLNTIRELHAELQKLRKQWPI